MTKNTQKKIKIGLISGISFGLFMAIFDYFDNNDFDIWKLIFNVLFFGLTMSFTFRFNKKS